MSVDDLFPQAWENISLNAENIRKYGGYFFNVQNSLHREASQPPVLKRTRSALTGAPQADGGDVKKTDAAGTTGAGASASAGAPVKAVDPTSWTAEALHTLSGVQLLQPRGRFDLQFRSVGITVTGKAGSASTSWDNVRHIIRLGSVGKR